MEKNAKIYIAGHAGLVGKALHKALEEDGYTNIVSRSFNELDLRNQEQVISFFSQERPDYVFLAAAKVGGIKANIEYPAEFMYDNLMIQTNILHASYLHMVKKLLFLGSSCIYPKDCMQPIKEEYLLTGSLEWTNEPYAIAKIAGIKLCQAYNRQYSTRFISCMPTNLYGPGDNFDLENSHVIPGLINKLYTAYKKKEPLVSIWGTGMVKREFLYIDDLASALIMLMKTYNNNDIINIGYGVDITIFELVHIIADYIGFEGKLIFDSTQPDGTKQKLLNISKIKALGWVPKVTLKEGLYKTINWFISNNQ